QRFFSDLSEITASAMNFQRYLGNFAREVGALAHAVGGQVEAPREAIYSISGASCCNTPAVSERDRSWGCGAPVSGNAAKAFSGAGGIVDPHPLGPQSGAGGNAACRVSSRTVSNR